MQKATKTTTTTGVTGGRVTRVSGVTRGDGTEGGEEEKEKKGGEEAGEEEKLLRREGYLMTLPRRQTYSSEGEWISKTKSTHHPAHQAQQGLNAQIF